MGLRHIIKDTRNFFNIGKLRQQLASDNYRRMLEYETVTSKEPGISDERYCDDEIIVSLTSYEKRLPIVYLSIASIMHQSLKPNRIVLWLSDELKGQRLPATLLLLQKRGLEIRYCTDIRSYKKLIPSLELYPNASIITIDDDVMYDITLIDRLVRAHIEEPKTVWANRVSQIQLNSNGEIKPYKKWTSAKPLEYSPFNIATGVGGILYPPHIFSDKILDQQKFMSLAPTADDLWFKAMEIVAEAKVKRIVPAKATGEDYLGGIIPYTDGLATENIINGQNDRIVKNLHEYFDLLPR